MSRVRHESELQFVDNYFSHDLWSHESARFLLSNGTYYVPDFYDALNRCFIEVVGTRQAYYHNRHKYALYKKEYDIPLLILKPDGTPFKPTPRSLMSAKFPMGVRIQKLSAYYGSRRELAKHLKCSERQVYNLQRGKGGVHLKDEVIRLYHRVVHEVKP